ncbi:small ribosomal subunit protein uS14-like [Saccopteryx leptura]|uniref:small ribosomal subunit protein uS14-like n=1 Tax=Saccopteryx leptura TaxID=249018 RepID=UPI00339BA3A2
MRTQREVGILQPRRGSSTEPAHACTLTLDYPPPEGSILSLLTHESKVGHQQFYWGRLGKFSQGSHSCHLCSNQHNLIWKYGLNKCHQCSHQYAKVIDFIMID